MVEGQDCEYLFCHLVVTTSGQFHRVIRRIELDKALKHLASCPCPAHSKHSSLPPPAIVHFFFKRERNLAGISIAHSFDSQPSIIDLMELEDVQALIYVSISDLCFHQMDLGGTIPCFLTQAPLWSKADMDEAVCWIRSQWAKDLNCISVQLPGPCKS